MTLERSEVAEGWEDLGVELSALKALDYGRASPNQTRSRNAANISRAGSRIFATAIHNLPP
jgi:hypothetical protein